MYSGVCARRSGIGVVRGWTLASSCMASILLRPASIAALSTLGTAVVRIAACLAGMGHDDKFGEREDVIIRLRCYAVGCGPAPVEFRVSYWRIVLV